MPYTNHLIIAAGFKSMSQRSALFAAGVLLSASFTGTAMAEVGDLRTSVGYSYTDSNYDGGFADAADRERYLVTARGTYTYTDNLKIGLSAGFGNSDADRNAPAFTDTDIETYAVNASYRVNDNWSAFAGIGYTELDTDGVDPFGTRFSTDGDGFSYVGGAVFNKEVSENAFFLLSGSVAYSEIDTDTFTSGVPGNELSVTTITVSPEFGVVRGAYTFTAGSSFIRANRDVRFVNDPTRFEGSIGVSYDAGNDWFINARVNRNFAEQATDTTRFNLNISKTINLLN